MTQLRYSDLRLAGDYAYWIHQDNAKHQLMRVPLGRALSEGTAITPDGMDVRSIVQGYGGGAYCVTPEHLVYFCNAEKHALYSVEAGSKNSPSLIAEGIFGDLEYDATHRLIYAIQELQNAGDEHPRTVICALRPSSSGTIVRIVVEGADFYSSPRISACGQRLCWVTWSFPDMPWDCSRLHVACIEDGRILSSSEVFNKPGASVVEPSWAPNGDLYFLQDETGWWSLAKWSATGGLCHFPNTDLEFGFPPYRLGSRTYSVNAGTNEPSVIAFAFRKGKLLLCGYTDNKSLPTVLSERFSEAAGLFATGASAYCLAASDDAPAKLVRIPLHSFSAANPTSPAPSNSYQATSRLWVPTSHGTIHAVLHTPSVLDRAPSPLIVDVHGGPTGLATGAYNPMIEYWLRQGYIYLEVNHRGSTGFGRDYRDALRGNWGVDDVEDCESAVTWLVSRGIVDPCRVAIRGASAGGYTALRAATTSEVFSASTCLYGVADLYALSMRTHKFESHYLDSLIGDPIMQVDKYIERSPVHATRMHCPILMLHGSKDKVVPVEQTRKMLEQVRRTNGRALHCEFFHEGHGFLDPTNRLIALRLEAEFYKKFLTVPTDRQWSVSSECVSMNMLLRNSDRCVIEGVGL